MEWFIYERDLRHERVNKWGGQEIIYQLLKIQVLILTKALIFKLLEWHYCHKQPVSAVS